MTPFQRSLRFAPRFSRACLVAFYSAIALLGSGGLHAIAPGCQSGCCAAPSATTEGHKGCLHHHHRHCPASPDHRQQNDQSRHCPEGCLICEFAATPAVPVVLVVILPQQELVEPVTLTSHVDQPGATAASFWIRGPPPLG